MPKIKSKIINEISLKHDVPVKDVEEMVNSQFSFVKEVIQSAEKDMEDTFKTVKLPVFGKFTGNKLAIRHIIRNKKKNGVRSNESTEE